MSLTERQRNLALVPIPTCRPTETRLAILNDGTGVTGAILCVESVADWEPGDPLHTRNNFAHQGFIYNFRDDTDRGESCTCPDAASWPGPRVGHRLTERDDIPRGSVTT